MKARRKWLVAAVIGIAFAGGAAYAAWAWLVGPRLVLRQIEQQDGRGVEVVCRWGVSPNREVPMAGGLFHCAVASGSREIVTVMMRHHADVNRVDGYGSTPLSVATSRGDLEMMRLLVSRGADASKAGRDGVTPLAIAVRENLEAPRRLLEQLTQKPIPTN